MLIKLPKYKFSDSKVIFREKQKDYDIFENESTIVFVYGYPYSTQSDKWVNSNDIYNSYITKRFDFIHLIDGLYSITIIDKIQNISFFIVDRYGVYSLFYYKCTNYILITDNIKEITNNLPEVKLNQQSIIEYLNFGFKIGNKTHINEIYEFEAAKKYEIGIDLIIKKDTYWDLLGLTENDKISYDKFREIFNNYHKKILNIGNTMCIPFTGGCDTRTILSAYVNNLDKIKTYTHGPQHHTDVTLAKKVSSALKIPHNFYNLDEKWFKDLVKKVSSNTEDFNGLNCFFDYIHTFESIEKEQNNADVFFSGVLGNQLYRNHPFGNNSPDSMNISTILGFILKNIPSVLNFKADLSSYYENLFNGLSIDEIKKQIKKSVEKELFKANGAAKAIDYLQYFLFSSYSANVASNSMKVIGKHFKTIGSFFHKDLLQQIKFMGLNERTSASIQNFIIKQNSPYLSKLPYYNTGRIVKYAKLVTNKLSSHIIKKDLFADPNLVNYPYFIRKQHKDFLLKTLDYEKMKSKKLFNKKELNKLINQFIENKSSFRNKRALLFNFSLDKFIINLISLELWLKGIK
ncbi:MAG: hypothetical protein ABFS35_15895 [Bacteroidota bacterium]